MGPVEVMLRWTISLQINFLLSNAYMKCWLKNFPQKHPCSGSLGHTADWVVLHGTWGKKKGGGTYWDFQALLPLATCWLPKADKLKVLMGAPSPHWLSQPLTSAPELGPYEMGDEETFCFRALAQKCHRAGRW